MSPVVVDQVNVFMNDVVSVQYLQTEHRERERERDEREREREREREHDTQ